MFYFNISRHSFLQIKTGKSYFCTKNVYSPVSFYQNKPSGSKTVKYTEQKKNNKERSIFYPFENINVQCAEKMLEP